MRFCFKKKINKIRCVTIFPECGNLGLIKEVGQIPYVLSKNHDDIDSILVTSDVNLNGLYVDKMRNVQFVHLSKIFNLGSLFAILYLLLNSRNIDWLFLYHIRRRTYILAKLFKFINPKGKVYVKLDMSLKGCELYQSSSKELALLKKIDAIADVISIETKEIKKRIQQYFSKDLLLIRNGVSEIGLANKYAATRKNSFLTVSRLGSEEKATDILLEAFALTSNHHDWDLELVGPIEEHFKQYLSEFFKRYPSLKNRVKVLGPIYDREELYKKYGSCRCFVLPSRWESYGISIAEALCCGCSVILSDHVPLSFEIKENLKCCNIVKANDINSLAQSLLSETQRKYDFSEHEQIAENSRKFFSWDLICEMLFNSLMSLA